MPRTRSSLETDSAARIRKFRFLDEVSRYGFFLDLYRSERPGDKALLDELVCSDDPLVKMLVLQYLEEIPEARAVRLFLPLLEDETDLVRDAAQRAFRRNPYIRKGRLLRPFVLSRNPRGAAVFAIRTLAEAGDMDIVPALLSLIEDSEASEPDIREAAIGALRYLPDPRSAPVLEEYTRTGTEGERYRAVRALAVLKSKGQNVPMEIFLRCVSDRSDRVRRASMVGMQEYPARRTADMFLAKAFDGEEPVAARRRWVQALTEFPAVDRVEPLLRLMTGTTDGGLRLSAEVTLKHFPAPVLREGLLPMLSAEDSGLKRAAGVILGERLGHDPAVRRRLMDEWNLAESLPEKLAQLEVLGEMGGAEIIEPLVAALKENELLAYAAIGVLGRVWTENGAVRIMELLEDPEMPRFSRQALLDTLLRRGPDDRIRGRLFPKLLDALGDEETNIRYLSVQLLEWYALDDFLEPVLRMLIKEPDDEVRRTVDGLICSKLGGDLRPLVLAVRKLPDQTAVRPHLLRLLARARWDEDRAFDVLYGLFLEPIRLPEAVPDEFSSLCVDILEKGSVRFEQAWLFVSSDEQRMHFLCRLRDAMRDPQRRFPELPLKFLAFHLAETGAAGRSLLYDIIGLSRQPEGIALLTGYALTEQESGPQLASQEGLRLLIRSAQSETGFPGESSSYLRSGPGIPRRNA